MANPLKQPGLGPDYEQLSAFIQTLSTPQKDGLLEYFGLDPTDELSMAIPALRRVIAGELPTIVWDNQASQWVTLASIT